MFRTCTNCGQTINKSKSTHKSEVCSCGIRWEVVGEKKGE